MIQKLKKKSEVEKGVKLHDTFSFRQKMTTGINRKPLRANYFLEVTWLIKTGSVIKQFVNLIS